MGRSTASGNGPEGLTAGIGPEGLAAGNRAGRPAAGIVCNARRPEPAGRPAARICRTPASGPSRGAQPADLPGGRGSRAGRAACPRRRAEADRAGEARRSERPARAGRAEIAQAPARPGRIVPEAAGRVTGSGAGRGAWPGHPPASCPVSGLTRTRDDSRPDQDARRLTA
jgi:hypothetical protein